MSIPKQPRQQMINMMYLVLTALLALNVSSEILDAFFTVKKSLDNSQVTVAARSNLILNQFDKEMQNRPAKAAPWQAKAKAVQGLCTDLQSQITTIKNLVTEESGGLDPKTGQVKRGDDLNVSSRLLIKEEHGRALRAKLLETRTKLLSYVEDKDKAQVASGLSLAADFESFPASKTEDWLRKRFLSMPTIASLTQLSTIENNLATSQAQVLEYLLNQIASLEMTVDSFRAVVYAPSSYIMEGETYNAEVFIASSSSTIQQEVSVGGRRLNSVEGIADYSVRASGPGEKTYSGVAKMFNPSTEEWVELPFSSRYFVANSMASISPTKMNMMFKGLKNPITVAVAGVDEGAVKLSASGVNCQIQKTGRGTYEVSPQGSGIATLTATATLESGTVKTFTQEFRVRPLPKPDASVRSHTGKIPLGLFKSSRKIKAIMKGIPWEDKPVVLGFTVRVFRDQERILNYTGSGASWSGRMASYVPNARAGDIIVFDVKVRNPDGSNHNVGFSLFPR